MQTITQIRALLAERGVRPRRRLGQNFLHDQNQIRKLIDAAQIAPGELVLEVGPGTGALTEPLHDAGAEIVACELDRSLAAIVDDLFGDRITLIRGDCLQKQRTLAPAIVEALAGRPFKLIANLPYQVASPLMTTLLIDHADCTGQFVTIQREVADRLLASAGTKSYGPLGIITGAMAEVRRIGIVPATCFWPRPKVTSAMVAILPSPPGRGSGDRGGEGSSQLASADDRRAFARFITDLFTKRRKQLGAILGRDHYFPAGIMADLRPEALSVAQLVALWQTTQTPGSRTGGA